MYLAGYIERRGTGTSDIVRKSLAKGLKEPEFIQAEDFRTIVYRPFSIQSLASTEQAAEQVAEQVKRLILALEMKSLTVKELLEKLEMKHRPTLIYNYLKPGEALGWVEKTIPESPNDPNQKYRLTEKGKAQKKRLQK